MVYGQFLAGGVAVLAAIVVPSQNGMPREPELRQWALDVIPETQDRRGSELLASRSQDMAVMVKDFRFTLHHERDCANHRTHVQWLIVVVQQQYVHPMHGRVPIKVEDPTFELPGSSG